MAKFPVRVSALQWAKPCLRPAHIPVSRRKKGVKAVGLRYEDRAAEAIYRASNGASTQGQWWEYFDAVLGLRHCQTDVIITGAYDPITDRQNRYIVEVKLTEVEEARSKLEDLYLPIVRRATADNVFGIVVSRHLTRTTARHTVVDSLSAAMRAAHYTIPVLHWLAKGPSI